jgi:hypothetical protein
MSTTVTLQHGIQPTSAYLGSADAEIGGSAGFHTYNYGGAGRPSEPYPLTVRGDSIDPFRVLLKFNVDFATTGIPADATINSATLYVYDFYGTHADILACHRALVSWVEGTRDGVAETGSCSWDDRVRGTTTWADPGGKSGTDYAASADDTFTTGTGAAWLDFDVTATVAAHVANASVNFGWFIIGPNSAYYHVFDSKESTVSGSPSSYRPKLSITYTAGGGATGGSVFAPWLHRRRCID